MELSSPAARAVFTRAYAGALRLLLGPPVKASDPQGLGDAIASLWQKTHQELEQLEGDRRHVPEEGRTLAQDLEDCVSQKTSAIFAEMKPKWADGRETRCQSSTYRAKYEKLLEQQHKAAAANRAAAERFVPPPPGPQAPVVDPNAQRQLPDLEADARKLRELEQQARELRARVGITTTGGHPLEDLVAAQAVQAAQNAAAMEQLAETPAAASAEPGKSSLVKLLMSRADGSAEPEEPSAQKSGNGKGDPALRTAAVSPNLMRAASRLVSPGPPDLRVETSNGELALHMLQEKWSFTDWAEAQGLSGAALREAKTHARAMELGVADYGVRYLTSRSAEVQARRMLALALTAASGNYRLGAKLEELPGEGVLSTLPDALAKSLAERLKLELKLEQLQKSGLSK